MRPQELNLLVIFDAIMMERSISRAADRLSMTQPAVSNAVARMRTAWNDTLFVKDGRNIQPTLYAKNLWAHVREPLTQLTEAIDPTEFDPASDKRTFRVCAADIVVDIAWPTLRKLVETQAPGINIHAYPYTIINTERSLNDAKVDLVVGAIAPSSTTFNSEFLFNANYVCVMRPGHPLTQQPLTLDAFAKAEHLLVSLSGDTTGFTDLALSQSGLRRRIAMTVNHFSAVAPLLEDSQLIAVVPSTTISDAIFSERLAVMPMPVEIPPNQVACFWHKRQDNDPGFNWLRQHLVSTLRQNAQQHYQKLQTLCESMPQCLGHKKKWESPV